jgi:hypothetical protein
MLASISALDRIMPHRRADRRNVKRLDPPETSAPRPSCQLSKADYVEPMP